MLAMCIADGLTVGNRVYRKGEVFPVPPIIESTMKELSDEQIARRQAKLYGKTFYRKATLEELVIAYESNKALAKSMSDRERKMIAAFKLQKQQVEEDFMAQLDVNPEEIEAMVNPKPKPVEPSEPDISEEEAVISEEMDEARDLVKEEMAAPKPTTTRKRSTSGRKKTTR